MIDDNVDENAEEDMEDAVFFFFYKNTSEPFEDHQIFSNSRCAAQNLFRQMYFHSLAVHFT